MSGRDYDSAVAVILVTTEPGCEQEVVIQLQTIPEVVEAILLFGEYDIFAKIKCSDFGVLSEVVVNKIRNISGIESTKTLTAAPML